MKKFLLSLLFASILPQIASSQNNVLWPFIEEGKKWVYEYYVKGEKKGDVIYYLDSVKKYGPEEQELDADIYVTFIDSTYYFAGLTELHVSPVNRVYINSSNDCNSTVLYDFGLTIDDGYIHTTGAWEKYYPYAWRLEDTKEVTIRGRKTKMQIMVPAFKSTAVSHIHTIRGKTYFFEGIGSTNGINPMGFVVSEDAFYFKGCYVGDELVATYEDLKAAIAEVEGTNAVEEIEAERERIIKEGIYDLQGRQLKEEPNHGIYIKDGKKIAR